MLEPPPPAWEDPFGDIHVRTGDRAPITGMTVRVIGHLEDRDQLERVLDGWQSAMAEPDGIGWLVDRLRQAGAADSSGTKDPN